MASQGCHVGPLCTTGTGLPPWGSRQAMSPPATSLGAGTATWPVRAKPRRRSGGSLTAQEAGRPGAGFSRPGAGSETRQAPRCAGSEGGSQPAPAAEAWRGQWRCISGCGACCMLDKGPLAPPIEDILTDAHELQLFRSMVGSDGWCVHYDKTSKECQIYDERPRFCRVHPDVFWDLYGVPEISLPEVAQQFCLDTIGDIHGEDSDVMQRFIDSNS